MDTDYQLVLECPKEKANWLSQLFFGWMIGTFLKGRKQRLSITDLYQVPKKDRSGKLGDVLEKSWQNEVVAAKFKNRTPSLLRVLCRVYGPNYMLWGVAMFVHIMLRAIQPMVISHFITLFAVDRKNNVQGEMYLYGTMLVLMSFFIFLLHHQCMHHFTLTGMRCKVSVSSLVYRKITRLSQTSLGTTTTGQIVNLLTNDVNSFEKVFMFLHVLWIIPFLLLYSVYFLWIQVGLSCLASLVSMALLGLFIQSYFAMLTKNVKLRSSVKTDHRVKLINEIVSGIQVIKLYTWEIPFRKLVKKVRREEMDDISIANYYQTVFGLSAHFLGRLTLCITITCYVLLGNRITSAIVFSISQSFNILQGICGGYYTYAVSFGSETLAAIQRLSQFLVLEERKSAIEDMKEGGVHIENVSAFWVPSTSGLKNINLLIPPRSLCAVVGRVGSGKSSLVQLLLGELAASSGRVAINGQISYASQQPWLFSATIRQNIIFGLPYDQEWYEKVVRVCALEEDFKQLPHRDRTLVGERGVSLSGGQKARINLARAVYRQADIYIMDDPLSAVDTHVGKYIFEKCICDHLQKKTRILVTHQLQYLKEVDLIVVVNQGEIEAVGTYEELASKKFDFYDILPNEDNQQPEKLNVEDDSPEEIAIQETFAITRKTSVEIPAPKQIAEEATSTGNITPLIEYIKAVDNKYLVAILSFLVIISLILFAAGDLWLAYWTLQEELRHSEATDIVDHNDFFYNTTNVTENVVITDSVYEQLKTNSGLYVYQTILLIAVIITANQVLLFFKMMIMASKNLHRKMFNCLLDAPKKFFDTNPAGRILNRFSKDMGNIDGNLPKLSADSIKIVQLGICYLLNIALSNPYVIAAILICGIVFWHLLKMYNATKKDIKLLEGVTKSPVLSHVTSTLNGLTTIRTTNSEALLVTQFDNHQDVHSAAWYLIVSCIGAFGAWTDLIFLTFTACLTYGFILMYPFSVVYSSFVGLAITQALALGGWFQFGIRQTSDMFNQLASVERVLQYTVLESEGPFETPEENTPEKDWPNSGQLEFRQVSLKYNEADSPVLKELTFTVHEGEKIGIVGRTGAGKSSLLAALFRLTNLDGNILIDGVDSKILGLTLLRRKMSIIPQEPVLFSSTLRFNLDPFEEFEDEHLWKVLDDVKLKDVVPSLCYMVSEGGNNFSLGQRQLVCLARAILRNNKILVLDEATANVDLSTDKFIQETIREKFKNCTVLTIAHRLNTIMDSDRIMVMSNGKNVEFDEPHKLLQNEVGYLTKLVDETGPLLSRQLRNVAHEKHRLAVSHDL